MRRNTQYILVSALLLGVLLLASKPLFHNTLFFTHDYLHAARAAEAARALKDGHFPLVWSQAFNFGYGMPLFEFYAPLPSIVGGVLFTLGLPITLSVRALFVLANMLTLAGAFLLGLNLLGKKNKHVGLGLVIATLYTLAPYRAVNLYVRGALSEAWGMAFYPWILVSQVWLVRKNKWGVPSLAVSTALLALSHNLSLLIFMPFAALFVTGYSLAYHRALSQKSTSKPKKLLHLIWSDLWRSCVAYLLGFGLAAFYLLPAFLEKNLVQVQNLITRGYFDFHLHFLYLRQLVTPYWGYGGSNWGPNDGLSFFLGFATLFAVGMVLIALPATFFLPKAKRDAFFTVKTRVAVMLLAATALIGSLLAVFLTTQKSLVVWEATSLLSFLQFPWRYLSVVSLFLAIAGGVGVYLWQSKNLRLALLTITLLLATATTWKYFLPEKFLDTSSSFYFSDADRITSQYSEALYDYLPQTMPFPATPSDTFIVSPDDIKFTETLSRVDQHIVSIDSLPNETTMEFAIAAYPGWQVFADGTQISTSYSENGLLTAQIPQDTQQVSIMLSPTPIRAAANAVSVLSIFVLLVYCVYTWRKRQGIHAE